MKNIFLAGLWRSVSLLRDAAGAMRCRIRSRRWPATGPTCRTGEWRYGFYDDVAIADGGFWDYGPVAVTASRADIVLRRGGESKHVVLRRDASAELALPRAAWLFSRPLVRATGYVAATRGDNRTMGEPSLVLDSVTVRGYLPGVKAGENVTMRNRISCITTTHSATSYQPSIHAGAFEAKLPCVCLSELSVECVAAGVYGNMYCAPAMR